MDKTYLLAACGVVLILIAAFTVEARVSHNGLAVNAMTFNAMTFNAMTFNAQPPQSLRIGHQANGIGLNGNAGRGGRNPFARLTRGAIVDTGRADGDELTSRD